MTDGARQEAKVSTEPPILECRAHHTGINDGDSEVFLDWAKGSLVTFLKAHYPTIAAWELYKPSPECIGKNVAPPQELDKLWRDGNGQVSLDKIQATLDEYARIQSGDLHAPQTPGSWPTLEVSAENARNRPRQQEEPRTPASIRAAKKAIRNMEIREARRAEANYDHDSPPSPVRILHMSDSGPGAGNKRKSKEIADREQEDNFTFLEAHAHFYRKARANTMKLPADTYSDRVGHSLNSMTSTWLKKKIESHCTAAFKEGWEACALARPEQTEAMRNLTLRAGKWLEDWISPRPNPNDKQQKDSHLAADERFAAILMKAGKKLLEPGNSLKTLFSNDSGQATMSALYQHFVPNADNYRRDLVANFRDLVPGQKPDGRGRQQLLPLEFSHPLSFATRLDNMASDIERVSEPVESVEKARILARAVPMIDEGRRRNGLHPIDLNGILVRTPLLAADYTALCAKIREHCDSVERQRIEVRSLSTAQSLPTYRPQESGAPPVQAMYASGNTGQLLSVR